MSNIFSTDELQNLKQGLETLGSAIETLATRETPQAEIGDRSLSGDKIHGGRITKFQSIGIKDDSTRLVVLVNDDGLLTDSIDVDTLIGDTKVDGNLNVQGEITAQKLHVNELSADIRNERTSPLEFKGTADDSVHGKGLLWSGEGHTKQFVFHANPERFFATENIDIHRDKSYYIGGVEVLNQNELGSSITKSSIKEVGTLQNLNTQGDLILDQFIFWNSDQERLGFGTDQPNAMLSIVRDSAEFVVEPQNDSVKIGTWTTSSLDFVTDDIVRLSVAANGQVMFGAKGSDTARVNIYGRLGVGVNNVPDDVSIATNGPISISGKKFLSGNSVPSLGTYNVGDIVWNDNPQPTGYVGWICIRSGTPGEWKPFGQIGN